MQDMVGDGVGCQPVPFSFDGTDTGFASPCGPFRGRGLHRQSAFGSPHANFKYAFTPRGAIAPELCMIVSPMRAWGMPGARCTRSLVCSVLVAHECRHHGRTGKHPAFPHAMVLTVSFVLSPEIGLFCLRHPRIKALSAPGRADIASANLTPASRRQDHTTSPSAQAPFVSALLIAHR